MRSGQCQWTSIELVMLSTFTFTVIAHHYSFCFSCGYLAHFQEEEKREKISNHDVCSYNYFVRLHWRPCQIPTTHEYIKIILLLARNSTWKLVVVTLYICVFACVSFVSHFCMGFYFLHQSTTSPPPPSSDRSSTISLPFLPFAILTQLNFITKCLFFIVIPFYILFFFYFFLLLVVFIIFLL